MVGSKARTFKLLTAAGCQVQCVDRKVDVDVEYVLVVQLRLRLSFNSANLTIRSSLEHQLMLRLIR